MSLTWSFESSSPLIACGIDSEKIDRFCKWAEGGEDPPRFVFSEREKSHCLSMAEPAAALCAAFCCKEAVLKAIGEPFNFPECELLVDLTKERNEIVIHENIKRAHGIGEAFAVIKNPGDAKEIVLVAYLFGTLSGVK